MMAPPAGAPEAEPVPEVSIIIPTYQRRDLVTRTVEALVDQTVGPERFEVIVVVDGSSDGTAASVRALRRPPNVCVIEQENGGRAAAINSGWRAARGAVLLLLDDDMRADPRMIEEHLRAIQQLDADAVMGLIAHDPASPVNVISEEVRKDFDDDVRELGGVFGPLPAGRRLVGAQLSIRRDLFEAVGGFDEGFTRHGHFGHADDDLGIRLRAAGGVIAFNGKAVTYQTFVRNFDSVLRQYEEYGRADVRLARKHREPEGPRPWAVPPRRTLGRMIAITTVRHPGAARWVGDRVRPLVRWMSDRGSTGGVARKLTYTMLFHHRYWLGVASAGGGRELGLGGAKSSLLVLAYHRIAAPEPGGSDRHANAPDDVLRQVRALVGDGWDLVSPHDVASFLRRGAGIPLRSLLITFDDGYADAASAGAQVLDDLGAKGLAFVVSARVGGTSDWAEVDPEPLLTGPQMHDMVAADRFEIGSHTRTHADLTRVSDEDLRDEVDESMHDLERLGLPTPRFLAYPFGDHDERVRSAAKRYLGAFTVDPGLMVAGSDPLRIPRISVRTGTTPERLVREARSLRWKARRRAMRTVLSVPLRPRRPISDGAGGGRTTTAGRASREPR